MIIVGMVKALLATFALVLASQEINLGGEWAVTIAAPRGALEYRMFLNHEGPRLSGYFQSEYGEIPVKGTLAGDEVKLAWTLMDGSKPIDVTMTGKVKGNIISGTAKLGTIGEGSFQAERTE